MFSSTTLVHATKAAIVIVVLVTAGLFVASAALGESLTLPGVVTADTIDTGQRLETTFGLNIGGLLALSAAAFALSVVAVSFLERLGSKATS